MINKIFLTILLISNTCFSQTTRPVLDKIGFIWEKNNLQQLIKYIEKNKMVAKCNSNLIAAITPHDDYLYAGDIEYSVLKNINAKEVVIFGVTHRSPRIELKKPKNMVIFDNFDQWEGLSGTVEISPLREILIKELNKNNYIISNKAHKLEHSIESIIPWLQLNNPKIKITPIMVSEMDSKHLNQVSDNISKIIVNYIKKNNLKLGTDIAFIFSCDTTHYGPDFKYSPYGVDENAHKKGIKSDKLTSKVYLENEITTKKIEMLLKETENKTNAWCGKYSVPFGLFTAEKVVFELENKNLTGKLVKYSDSFSHGVLPVKIKDAGVTAPSSLEHWVGHLAVVYTIASE